MRLDTVVIENRLDETNYGISLEDYLIKANDLANEAHELQLESDDNQRMMEHLDSVQKTYDYVTEGYSYGELPLIGARMLELTATQHFKAMGIPIVENLSLESITDSTVVLEGIGDALGRMVDYLKKFLEKTWQKVKRVSAKIVDVFRDYDAIADKLTERLDEAGDTPKTKKMSESNSKTHNNIMGFSMFGNNGGGLTHSIKDVNNMLLFGMKHSFALSSKAMANGIMYLGSVFVEFINKPDAKTNAVSLFDALMTNGSMSVDDLKKAKPEGTLPTGGRFVAIRIDNGKLYGIHIKLEKSSNLDDMLKGLTYKPFKLSVKEDKTDVALASKDELRKTIGELSNVAKAYTAKKDEVDMNIGKAVDGIKKILDSFKDNKEIGKTAKLLFKAVNTVTHTTTIAMSEFHLGYRSLILNSEKAIKMHIDVWGGEQEEEKEEEAES
jgi:hypothetical protein